MPEIKEWRINFVRRRPTLGKALNWLIHCCRTYVARPVPVIAVFAIVYYIYHTYMFIFCSGYISLHGALRSRLLRIRKWRLCTTGADALIKSFMVIFNLLIIMVLVSYLRAALTRPPEVVRLVFVTKFVCVFFLKRVETDCFYRFIIYQTTCIVTKKAIIDAATKRTAVFVAAIGRHARIIVVYAVNVCLDSIVSCIGSVCLKLTSCALLSQIIARGLATASVNTITNTLYCFCFMSVSAASLCRVRFITRASTCVEMCFFECIHFRLK